MAAFLQSARTGDAAVERFVAEHFDQRERESRPMLAPNMIRIAGLIRGQHVEEIVKSNEMEIAVRFSTSSGPLTLGFVCSEAPPHRLVDWRRYD